MKEFNQAVKFYLSLEHKKTDISVPPTSTNLIILTGYLSRIWFYQSEQEARFHYPLEHPIYRTWCYKISNEQHKVLGAVKSI
jgi:hypothetical protein